MSDATNPNDLADAPHLLRARPVSVIERIATAEELASVVRHDVRNKLGSVRNAAFFIERKLQRENLLQDDPRTQEFLKLIATELDRANELLDDGFTFTRLHPRAVGDQTLAGALTQVLSALPEALRERVTVDVGEEARVHADAEELHLLLSCLLDNALEASPASAVRVRADRVDGVAQVTVEDDGPGLSLPSRDALRAFRSSKAGHDGIGLNIAQRIARRHGGSLELESPATPTTGTRVVIRFPVSLPDAEPTE